MWGSEAGHPTVCAEGGGACQRPACRTRHAAQSAPYQLSRLWQLQGLPPDAPTPHIAQAQAP